MRGKYTIFPLYAFVPFYFNITISKFDRILNEICFKTSSRNVICSQRFAGFGLQMKRSTGHSGNNMHFGVESPPGKVIFWIL